MNRSENKDGDILRQYLDPEKIEKAPEGFTIKVMENISLEAMRVKQTRYKWLRNPVPVISVSTTAVLIILALIIPETYTINLNALNIFRDFRFPEIQTGFDSLFNIDLPAVTAYLMAGLLLLAIFDKALFGIFNRERK